MYLIIKISDFKKVLASNQYAHSYIPDYREIMLKAEDARNKLIQYSL